VTLNHVTLLSAVMRTSLSTIIRQSTWAVMALEAVHLIGLTLLGGPAVVMALGALRPAGLRGLSVSTLTAALLPVLWIGLLLMAISGSLIAIAMPFKYYGNAAFRWKMLLLLLAVAATVALVRTARDINPAVDTPGPRRRALALVALLLWFAVGFSGRLIGFL
jgi:hypothetical protein